MERLTAIPAPQLERFARFLDEHPGFSPVLVGENALVRGFQVGGSNLTLDEMEAMIAIQPHFDELEAALLLASVHASVNASTCKPASREKHARGKQ
jgi:hypothetical protein